MALFTPWSGHAADTLLCLSTPDQHQALYHAHHCLRWQETPAIEGTCYHAQVRAHWPERQAYLVSWGTTEGFLPEKHCFGPLRIGQRIVIQCLCDATQDKRARVSMKLCLRGQFGTLFLRKQSALQYIPETTGLPTTLIAQDESALRAAWDAIQEACRHHTRGCLWPIDPTAAAWQQLPWTHLKMLWLSPKAYDSFISYQQSGTLQCPDTCVFRLLDSDTCATYLAPLIACARSPWVLPNGSRLHIDCTAVGPAIDIDSHHSHHSAKRINEDALPYIAQAISLYGLQGAIVIDVLDMQETQARKELRDRFLSYCRQLPIPQPDIQYYGDWLRCFCHKRKHSDWQQCCEHCEQKHITLPPLLKQLESCLHIQTLICPMSYAHITLRDSLYQDWKTYFYPLLSADKRNKITYSQSPIENHFQVMSQTRQQHINNQWQYREVD